MVELSWDLIVTGIGGFGVGVGGLLVVWLHPAETSPATKNRKAILLMCFMSREMLSDMTTSKDKTPFEAKSYRTHAKLDSSGPSNRMKPFSFYAVANNNLQNLMNPYRFAAFLIALSFAGCTRVSSVFETYTGDGTITTDQRHLAKFQAIDLEGAYDVILSQGEPSEVRIETDKNLLDHITTKVKDGKLTVSSEGNLRPTKTIKLYISSPTYSAIDLAGSGDIHAPAPITSDKLTLGLAGSGNYDLQVKVKDL